jgi:hypothetical protein
MKKHATDIMTRHAVVEITAQLFFLLFSRSDSSSSLRKYWLWQLAKAERKEKRKEKKERKKEIGPAQSNLLWPATRQGTNLGRLGVSGS